MTNDYDDIINLTLPDIASMLNGILILRHKVRIDRLTDGCDSYLIHIYLCRTALGSLDATSR